MTASWKTVGQMLSGLLLAVLGVAGALTGIRVFADWFSLSGGSRAYYSLSLLAGLTLLASGAVLVAQHSRQWLHIGAAAGVVLLANQAIGIWLNTLLCFTPT